MNRKNEKVISIVLGAFIALMIELMAEAKYYFLHDTYTGILNGEISIEIGVKVLIATAIFAVVLYLLELYSAKLLPLVDKYRYLIAVLVVAILTALKINGSSLAIWNIFFGINFESVEDMRNSGIIFGIPRMIRSDEWAMSTVFQLSQVFCGFGAKSDLIRGTTTDVLTACQVSAWAPVTIFRPFLWGYMLLGNEYGLAFFWVSRVVALFMVSYECGKIWLKNNKYLSAIVAVLFALSPMTQWWFSTVLVEMFFFGQLAIVFLYLLIRQSDLKRSILLSLGLAWCAGGYLFTYYPAWEVSLAYVFLCLAIFVIADNWSEVCLRLKRNILLLVFCMVVFGGAAAAVLWQSKEAIIAMQSTVYPGKRVSLGGTGDIKRAFFYAISELLPIDETRLGAEQNASEMSGFFSVFPIGLILTIYRIVKDRKNKIFEVSLLVVYVAFFIYSLFGFPEKLARITFMTYASGKRVIPIIAIIDVIFVLRYLCDEAVTDGAKSKVKKVLSIIAPLAYAAIIWRLWSKDIAVPIFIIGTIVLLLMFYTSFVESGRTYKCLLIEMAVVVGITGLMVNPIQRGLDKLGKSDELLGLMMDINEADPGKKWMVTDVGYPFNNYPLAAGISTVGSTNVYPALEIWSELDPTGEYNEVYNRYAHVSTTITTENTEFSLMGPDYFSLLLNVNDIDKLDISYILSPRIYEEEWALERFTEIGSSGIFHVYKVNN